MTKSLLIIFRRHCDGGIFKFWDVPLKKAIFALKASSTFNYYNNTNGK